MSKERVIYAGSINRDHVINITDEPFYAYLDEPRFNSQYEEYGA